MANYVEYIKVENGESWPIRDRDAQNRLLTAEEGINDNKSAIEALDKTVKGLAQELENDGPSNEYLPFAGGSMTGPIDMNGNRIMNLPAPVDDKDAATKGYVDSIRDAVLSVEVTDNTAVPLTINNGEVIMFTYITSYTGGLEDILLKVNDLAPQFSGYTYPYGGGTAFVGGVICYSGTAFNAVVNGVIRVVNGITMITTQDIRGNNSGQGWGSALWTNVGAVNSLTFSRGGSLIYNRI